MKEKKLKPTKKSNLKKLNKFLDKKGNIIIESVKNSRFDAYCLIRPSKDNLAFNPKTDTVSITDIITPDDVLLKDGYTKYDTRDIFKYIINDKRLVKDITPGTKFGIIRSFFNITLLYVFECDSNKPLQSKYLCTYDIRFSTNQVNTFYAKRVFYAKSIFDEISDTTTVRNALLSDLYVEGSYDKIPISNMIVYPFRDNAPIIDNIPDNN